jgi:hypothetical protein
MPPQFLTLPKELVPTAERLVRDFRARGYRVHLEPYELGYPYAPALVVSRSHESIIVEVSGYIEHKRVHDWVRFGRSCSEDTRFAIGVNTEASVSTKDEQVVREAGAGLFVVSNAAVVERVAPLDLALHLALPELTQQPLKVKTLLGPSYDQIARGEWRDGFGDACQVLEVEARKYLQRGIRSGRITFRNPGGSPHLVTVADVHALTMGQLVTKFDRIAVPNRTDSQIYGALSRLNPDRVAVTHHRSSRRAETRLRSNVGRHMWMLPEALKLTLA